MTSTAKPGEVDGRGRSISTAILYDVWSALRELEPGGEVAVVADMLPAVDSDVRAWCRTTGHELRGAEERGTERRYPDPQDRAAARTAAVGARDP